MKQCSINLLILLLTFLVVACASTNKIQEPTPTQSSQPVVSIKEEPVIEQPKVEPEIESTKVEPVIETPAVVETPIEKTKEEPIPETPKNEIDAKKEEYNRSTCLLHDEKIPEEVFTEDKKAILNIISELSSIMQNKDYMGWIKYLSEDSILYWRNSANLSSISKRLPIKGLRLKTLEDYFRNVFIPSRLNRNVDEIRYISKTKVKAVQMNNNEDIIYYEFEKINGKWLLNLEKL